MADVISGGVHDIYSDINYCVNMSGPNHCYYDNKDFVYNWL